MNVDGIKGRIICIFDPIYVKNILYLMFSGGEQMNDKKYQGMFTFTKEKSFPQKHRGRSVLDYICLSVRIECHEIWRVNTTPRCFCFCPGRFTLHFIRIRVKNKTFLQQWKLCNEFEKVILFVPKFSTYAERCRSFSLWTSYWRTG